jgi:hypothetical protein
VPRAEAPGLREGVPLHEPLPDELMLPEAVSDAQVLEEEESDAVVVVVAQWLLLGLA